MRVGEILPRTVNQAFDVFFERLTPFESQRTASARHRASIESSLRKALRVSTFRETGSFSHGTGVRNHCDVDLLVSIRGGRPGSSDTALGWVKDALSSSFPYTTVRVSRPAVVVEFADGAETWEIIPGFLTDRGGPGVFIYDIPGAASGWLDSAPGEHIEYVNEVNGTSGIRGGAKKLSRLAKAWKYYMKVPVSSFYLEMRAAHYMSGEKSFIPVWDVCRYLEELNRLQLSAMNDPTGNVGRFYACSSTSKGADALSKLKTAVTRARNALDAENSGDAATAFYYLDLLFGGNFPARV
jgi:hypothetical protein